MKVLLLAALSAAALGQDTHYCPDGWVVSDFDNEVECILLGGVDEKVTNDDASILCQFHGGWLVDMDEGRGPAKNNFLKSLISDAVGNGGFGNPGLKYDDQWWIGAHVSGPHGDHNWGNWTWDHNGEEIQWYDWMRNEPNDWHSQNCLTFLKDQDIFGYGTYHWNDWDCDTPARFICERPPLQATTTSTTTPATTTTTTTSTTSKTTTTTTTTATTTTTTTTTKTSTTTSTTTATTTTTGPEECPYTSSSPGQVQSRSAFCPQTFCPAVLIESQGGAMAHQVDSLGCYNYEGSLLGDRYPNYVHRSGQFLTPGEHTSWVIGYSTWIVSTDVLSGNGTIRNVRHDTITCPYDIPDGWEYWDGGKWVEDTTLTVTCPGHW